MAGDTVQIMCMSTTAANWTFNDDTLPNNAHTQGDLLNIIEIQNIDVHNNGFYDCLGTDEQYKPFITRAILKINITSRSE